MPSFLLHWMRFRRNRLNSNNNNKNSSEICFLSVEIVIVLLRVRDPSSFESSVLQKTRFHLILLFRSLRHIRTIKHMVNDKPVIPLDVGSVVSVVELLLSGSNARPAIFSPHHK